MQTVWYLFVWLLSLSLMLWCFPKFLWASVICSFHCWRAIRLCGVTTLFIHSAAGEHWGCLQVLGSIMEKLWTFIYKSLWGFMVLFFLGKYLVGSRIGRSYGKCLFALLRICQTIFRNGFTILRSYQRCLRIPHVPPSHRHWCCLANFSFPGGGVVPSPCIFHKQFPGGNDVERHFTWRWPLSIFCVCVKCLVSSFAHLLLDFLFWGGGTSLYIQEASLLSNAGIGNIFSQTVIKGIL